MSSQEISSVQVHELLPRPYDRIGQELALVLVAVLLAGGVLGGCRGSDSRQLTAEQEEALADSIRSLIQKQAKAWSTLNPDAYLQFFSDDVQFYYQGSRQPRAEFEKGVRQAMAGYRKYPMEVLSSQVDVLGPGAVVASFRYHGQPVDTTGKASEVRAAMTLAYERRDGDWKIVQAHESFVPPEQSP